jgi:hypothetical protein
MPSGIGPFSISQDNRCVVLIPPSDHLAPYPDLNFAPIHSQQDGPKWTLVQNGFAMRPSGLLTVDSLRLRWTCKCQFDIV